MLKLTKTGIGLLTKQYRSVLLKCFFLNLGLFIFTSLLVTMAPNISLASDLGDAIQTGPLSSIHWGAFSGGGYSNIYRWDNSYGGGFAMATGYTPGTSEAQINLQIDGYFYQNEGYYRVLDTSNISNAINSTSTSTVASSAAVNAVRQLIPTNTNQLTNGAGFITKSVSDLTNYYTKSETYSRNEIANLDSLNYYYTFRVDESNEVIDYTSFFQKDFSTLQEVDLHIKNPTHLGAFTKCNEVCPRPSERFSSSLRQEQMLKNDASVDAGTSRHCLRQFGDVVADLLKNMASKYAKMNDFMNEEVRHA